MAGLEVGARGEAGKFNVSAFTTLPYHNILYNQPFQIFNPSVFPPTITADHSAKAERSTMSGVVAVGVGVAAAAFFVS